MLIGLIKLFRLILLDQLEELEELYLGDHILKKLLLHIEGALDSFLDNFSLRLCYGCNKASASIENKFFCEACYEALAQEFKYCKKHLGFNFFELDQILKDLDPVIYPQIYFVYKYDDLTKHLMRNFKYRKPYFKKFFAKELLKFLLANLTLIFADSKPDTKKSSAVIGTINLFFAGVPLHEERLEKRTYNQSELLAEETCKQLQASLQNKRFFVNYQSIDNFGIYEVKQITFLKNLFIRKKKTETLFNKTKDERLNILKNAFAVNPAYAFLKEYKIKNENVLIVFDDICTTGATFLEIFKVIYKAKLKFDEIVFVAATGRNL